MQVAGMSALHRQELSVHVGSSIIPPPWVHCPLGNQTEHSNPTTARLPLTTATGCNCNVLLPRAARKLHCQG
jgi:hypothetical protein